MGNMAAKIPRSVNYPHNYLSSAITQTKLEAINWRARDPFAIPSMLAHGGLLSLNAWKLSPTPRKIEMVTYTHSNEPDNRCLLEPAVHGVHKT